MFESYARDPEVVRAAVEKFESGLGDSVERSLLSRRTVTEYRRIVRRHFSAVADLSWESARSAMKSFLDLGRSKSHDQMRKAFASFAKTAELPSWSAGLALHPPLCEPERPTLPLSESEHVALRTRLSAPRAWRRALFYDLSLATGARESEIAGVCAQDFDRSDPRPWMLWVTLRQKRKVAGAMPATRTVPVLDAFLAMELRRLLDGVAGPPSLLGHSLEQRLLEAGFPSAMSDGALVPAVIGRAPFPCEELPDPLMLSSHRMRLVASDLSREIGSRFHMHRLRATMASLLHDRGHENWLVRSHLACEAPAVALALAHADPEVRAAGRAAAAPVWRRWLGHCDNDHHRRYVRALDGWIESIGAPPPELNVGLFANTGGNGS